MYLVVKTTKEETVVSHPGKEVGLFPAVSKRVDLPGNLRPAAGAKSTLEELHPEAHVVDDGRVVGGSLVVHGPATPDELEPSRFER